MVKLLQYLPRNQSACFHNYALKGKYFTAGFRRQQGPSTEKSPRTRSFCRSSRAQSREPDAFQERTRNGISFCVFGERAGCQPAVAGSLPAIIRIINAIRNHSLGKAAETYRLAAVLPPEIACM